MGGWMKEWDESGGMRGGWMREVRWDEGLSLLC